MVKSNAEYHPLLVLILVIMQTVLLISKSLLKRQNLKNKYFVHLLKANNKKKLSIE